MDDRVIGSNRAIQVMTPGVSRESDMGSSAMAYRSPFLGMLSPCICSPLRLFLRTRIIPEAPAVKPKGSNQSIHENAGVSVFTVQTCRLPDVDPQAWLADVLSRIAECPVSKLYELLPWNWQVRKPLAVFGDGYPSEWFDEFLAPFEPFVASGQLVRRIIDTPAPPQEASTGLGRAARRVLRNSR